LSKVDFIIGLWLLIFFFLRLLSYEILINIFSLNILLCLPKVYCFIACFFLRILLWNKLRLLLHLCSFILKFQLFLSSFLGLFSWLCYSFCCFPLLLELLLRFEGTCICFQNFFKSICFKWNRSSIIKIIVIIW
jgi:hypothetical protein